MRLLTRALQAVGLQRMEQSSTAGGGHLVPAGTTISQILDYVSGSGDLWPLDLYRAGLPLTRDIAVSYATLNRCVTVISGAIAQLIAGGHVYVVDGTGRRRMSRRAERVVEVLRTSADGGEMQASSFIEDAVADYLLDGNALIVASWSSDGRLEKLRRYSPWDADVFYSEAGEAMYRLTPADGMHRVSEYHSARDLIHVRWPRMLRYGNTRNTRVGFAMAPVIAMRPALEIGLQGDRYIRDWFRRGAQSNLHIDYPLLPDEKAHSTEQRKDLREAIRKQLATRAPLVTFGAKSTSIDDTPQDSSALALREYQVQEVGRYYGVPAPLLGVQVTDWGSGIEQLGKLFWRFGLQQHLFRFLAPLALRLLRSGDRFHVDTTELLRGDSESIRSLVMALQGDAQRPPVATRDELRHIAGLTVDPVGEFREWASTPAPMQAEKDPNAG